MGHDLGEVGGGIPAKQWLKGPAAITSLRRPPPANEKCSDSWSRALTEANYPGLGTPHHLSS
jgi:hypothetical protein